MKNLLLLVSMVSVVSCAVKDIDDIPEERKYLLVEFNDAIPGTVVSVNSEIHRMTETKLCGIRANIISTSSNPDKRFIILRPKEGECDLEEYSEHLESFLIENSESAVVSIVTRTEYAQVIKQESIK